MKRKVTFSLIFLLGSVVFAATGPNLIYNPSAEIIIEGQTSPDGWRPYSYGGNPELAIDSTEAYSGTNSLKIISTSDDKSMWISPSAPLKSGVKIKAGLYYKCANSSPTGGSMRLSIRYINASGQVFPIKDESLDRNASSWTAAETEVVTPAEAVKVQVIIRTDNLAGTLWIDDVWLSVVVDEDDIEDPLSPMNLWANRVADNKVELKWDTPGPASDGDLPVFYHIHRGEDRELIPGEENRIASIYSQPDSNYFADNTVEVGKKYYYLVASMDKMGNLAYSQLAVASNESHLPKNLIELNASFDEWENGIPKYFLCNNKSSLYMDCEDKVDGEASVKITNSSDTEFNRISRIITVKKETNYILSIWVKSESLVKGPDGLGGKVIVEPEIGPQIHNHGHDFVGSCAWQEEKIFFTTGDYETITILLYLHKSKGSIWFDNLVLIENIIDGTPPEVPVDFTVTRINGTSKTEFTWQMPLPAPDGGLPIKYRIYWGESSEFSLTEYHMLVELPHTDLMWMHDSSPSTKIHYVVTALDECGNESDPSPVRSSPKVGSMRGKVVTAVGLEPLAGAEVFINELDLTPVNTSADGYFIFEMLLAQQYSLVVRLPKYKRKRLSYPLAEGEDYYFGEVQMDWYDTPPKAPPVIVADGESHVGMIKITWEIPEQEDEDNIIEFYNVYRNDNQEVMREPSQWVASVEEPIYEDVRPPEDYGKTFYYIVEAVNEAGIPSFDVSEFSSAIVKVPPVPQPLSPTNGELILNSKPEFTWLEVEDPNLTGYVLQVSSDPNFPVGKTLDKDSGVIDRYEWHEILEQKKWFWRIRAQFGIKVLSNWSESGEFITVNNQEENSLVPYYIIFPKALTTGDVEINYLLTAEANVTLQVYNLGGKLVATLQSGFLEAGPQSYVWKGIDSQGRELPNGLYFIQLHANSTGIERVKTNKKLVIVR
jgi:fibronectin type 3 domain-containing protein